MDDWTDDHFFARPTHCVMDAHSELSPETLAVEVQDAGVLLEYADGREVFYHGAPERVASPHQTAPGKDVHLLVTDASARQGVMLYVNERRTADDILAETGVGRLFVTEGENRDVFPGVTIRGGSLRCEIAVDHAAVDGRVLVFEEDQFEERSTEIVPE